MQERQDLLVRILGDSSPLNKSLGRAEGKLKQFSGKLKSIGRTLTTRITLPIAAAGGAAIKMASDMEESMNKVDVSFGRSSKKVKEFAKTTLTEFGIAESSALEMTALFGDMATGMGISQQAAADMSIQLSGLAGDLASFKNIRIDTAQTALAAIFTGETESLKRLGIVMTQANLDAFALTQGINKQVKEMSEAEKINLRLAFVMDRTRNAQGDFARTSGGAANQMRIFQESLKEIGAQLGEIILPVFTKFLKKVNTALKRFKSLSDESKKLVVALAGAAGLAPVLVMLASLIAPLITAFSTLTGSYIALGTAIYAATEAIDYFVEKLTGLKNFGIVKFLVGPLGLVNEILGEISKKKVGDVFKDLFKTVEPDILPKDFIGPATREQTTAALGGDPLLNAIVTANEKGKKGNEIISSGRKAVSVLNSIKSKGIIPMTDAAIKAGESIKKVTEPVLSDFQFLAFQIMPQVGQALTEGFASIADGENPLKRIFTILKGLIARLIAAATAAALLSFFLGGNLGGFGKIFKVLSGGIEIPGMAKGGIAFGQTPVMVGDYSGVRSNPEVIAPLNKLQSMMGGSQNVTGEFVLRGQDLIVALQRAEKSRNRTL